MTNNVCCVCQQLISKEAEKKNIFKDHLLIKRKLDKTEETKENKVRLDSGIELITGYKVFETGKSSSALCYQCFQKLENFMNFRAQLLSSFGILINEQSSFNSLKHTILETAIEKDENSLKEHDLDYLIETSDCPKLPNSQLISEDLINVDENSTSLDVTTVQNDEDITNDSTNWNKLKNDEKNNNPVDSESSNDNIDVQNDYDSPMKVLSNDIESEIDVCSGEDDEVLEIENERGKVNVREDEISSESDIDVCDYEPTGKKTKHLNSHSQPLVFEM